MNSRLRTVSMTGAALLVIALAGCDDKAKASDSASSTASAEPAAASTEAPKAAPAGDVGASKVAKPLADWQSDDVKSALEKGGWKVNGATQTKSAMLSIIVNATKGASKAKVNYYKNGGAYWKKSLEKDNAVIHEDGDVIVGVVIEGDKDGAQKLLNSLLGK
jgi:hypothetical protein